MARGVSEPNCAVVDETLIVGRVEDACLRLSAPAAPASQKPSFVDTERRSHPPAKPCVGDCDRERRSHGSRRSG